jgi:hypothetical protein
MIREFGIVIAASLLAIAPSVAQTVPSLPDSQKTPGDPLEVVPADSAACLTGLLGKTIRAGDPVTLPMICTPNYTRCIRDVTAEEKKAVYTSYGLEGDHTGYCNGTQGCEIDHLISLEIGGSNAQKNLWPQPYQGEAMNAHVKDQLEKWLHNEVCTGRMSLKQAQSEISSNWITSFNNHLGSR